VDQLPLVSHLRIHGYSLASFSYIKEQWKAPNSVSQSSPTHVFLLSRVTHREYCEVLSFPILTQWHARVSIYPRMEILSRWIPDEDWVRQIRESGEDGRCSITNLNVGLAKNCSWQNNHAILHGRTVFTTRSKRQTLTWQSLRRHKVD
jgi:hypothetical protein